MYIFSLKKNTIAFLQGTHVTLTLAPDLELN